MENQTTHTGVGDLDQLMRLNRISKFEKFEYAEFPFFPVFAVIFGDLMLHTTPLST